MSTMALEPENSWWVISADDLRSMLHRAHAGEDPEEIYAEESAMADHKRVPGEDDESRAVVAECHSCGQIGAFASSDSDRVQDWLDRGDTVRRARAGEVVETRCECRRR